jgi:hypothetical protein
MKTKTLAMLAAGCLLSLSMAGRTLTAEEFIANLDGLQENPPVATPGFGSGTVSYDPIANTLSVTETWSDLTGTTSDSHIHCCAGDPTLNATVAIGFTSTGFPIGVTAGTYSQTFDLSDPNIYAGTYFAASGGTADSARDRLLAAMRGDAGAGIAYFNVHSSFRLGGEIRGNIVPIPEPSSLALLAMGGVGLAFAWRRRRRAG